MSDYTDDSIVPGLSAERVRTIASVWLRPDVPQLVRDELESHAMWLCSYRRFLTSAIESVTSEKPALKVLP